MKRLPEVTWKTDIKQRKNDRSPGFLVLPRNVCYYVTHKFQQLHVNTSMWYYTTRGMEKCYTLHVYRITLYITIKLTPYDLPFRGYMQRMITLNTYYIKKILYICNRCYYTTVMYDFSDRLRNTTISEDNITGRLRSLYVVVFTCPSLKHHSRNVYVCVATSRK